VVELAWNDATMVAGVTVQESNMIENRFQPAEPYAYGFGHGMNEYYQQPPVSLDVLSCSVWLWLSTAVQCYCQITA